MYLKTTLVIIIISLLRIMSTKYTSILLLSRVILGELIGSLLLIKYNAETLINARSIIQNLISWYWKFVRQTFLDFSILRIRLSLRQYIRGELLAQLLLPGVPAAPGVRAKRDGQQPAAVGEQFQSNPRQHHRQHRSHSRWLVVCFPPFFSRYVVQLP